MHDARDAQLEQIPQVLNEARAGLLGRGRRHEPADGVLSLPDDAVELASRAPLYDATVGVGARPGDTCELEGEAVDHGAVPAGPRQRHRVAGGGFVQVLPGREALLRENILGPAVAGDPLALAELRTGSPAKRCTGLRLHRGLACGRVLDYCDIIIVMEAGVWDTLVSSSF